MRKEVLLLFLLVLSIIPVQALTGHPADENISIQKPDLNNLKDKTDNVVEKKINLTTLSETWQGIIKAFTRFSGEVTLSQIIVFLLVSFLFFLTFNNTFSIFSPFGGATRLGISLMMTLLSGVIGILKGISMALLSLSETMKWLAGWSTAALAFITVLIIVLWIVLSKVSVEMRRRETILRGKQEGAEVGAKFGFLEALKNIVNFTKENS